MTTFVSTIIAILLTLNIATFCQADQNEFIKFIESKESWISYSWGNYEEDALYKAAVWKLSGHSKAGDILTEHHYDLNFWIPDLRVTHLSMSVGYPDKNVRRFSVYSELTYDDTYYRTLVKWCDEWYGEHTERDYFSGEGAYRSQVMVSEWDLGNTLAAVSFNKNLSIDLNSRGNQTTLRFTPNQSHKTITSVTVGNPAPISMDNSTTSPGMSNDSPLLRTTAAPDTAAPVPRRIATNSQPATSHRAKEPRWPVKGVWLSSDRFEIAHISDYKQQFSPAEPVVFLVKGKSDRFSVDPATGFTVIATLYDSPGTTILQTTGLYDPDKGAWQVTLSAPTDSSQPYRLMVSLSCMTTGSQCADVYGLGSQVERPLPLKVH